MKDKDNDQILQDLIRGLGEKTMTEMSDDQLGELAYKAAKTAAMMYRGFIDGGMTRDEVMELMKMFGGGWFGKI